MHGHYGTRSGTKMPLYWTMQRLFALATGLLQLALRVDERDAKSNILSIVQLKSRAKSRADANLDHTGSTVRLGSESGIWGERSNSQDSMDESRDELCCDVLEVSATVMEQVLEQFDEGEEDRMYELLILSEKVLQLVTMLEPCLICTSWLP